MDASEGRAAVPTRHPDIDSPRRTDIAVVTGYERSPARVVCHKSVNATSQGGADISGLVTHNVSVGAVPTLQQRPTPLKKPPSPTIHDQSSTQRTPAVISPLRPEPTHNFVQPNFDDTISRLTSYSPPPSTVDSDNSQPEIIDVPPRKASEKKPKRKVVTVPSRYAQAAVTKYQPNESVSTTRANMSIVQPKKPNSARGQASSHPQQYWESRPKTSTERRNTSRPTSDPRPKTTSALSNPKFTKPKPTLSDPRSKATSALNNPRLKVTVPDDRPKIRECTTSTPTQELPFFDIDASAIVADNGASFVKPHPMPIRGPTTAPIDLSQMSFVNEIAAIQDIVKPQTTKKKKPPTSEVTQQDIDIAYARYLQWMFLDSSVQKAFRDQQKTAMAQLAGEHERDESLRKRKADLDEELAVLSHSNQLDVDLDIQRLGLGPVIANMQQYEHDHGILTSTIDNTRQQITTKGVYLGPDKDLLQDSLVHALRESEQILGHLSVITRDVSEDHDRFASSIGTLATTCTSEQRELTKLRDLVAVVDALTLEESSLRIQAMQMGTA